MPITVTHISAHLKYLMEHHRIKIFIFPPLRIDSAGAKDRMAPFGPKFPYLLIITILMLL